MKKNKLHTIKSSGFKTPEHYFESFETEFFELLKDKESIKTSESSGFTMPNNYFDSVETTILEKLQTQPEKPVVVLKSRRTFYYVAGIAASFMLLFGLVFNNDQLSIDTINTASIENYLYQEEYTSAEFATLFKSDDISETDFINLNISDETLYEYIENTDAEDLILD